MIEPNVLAKIVQFLNTANLKPSDIADFQAVMAVLEREFMESRNPPKPQMPVGTVIPTDSDLIPLG